ncbi:hypothetical protein [Methyloversatilis sp.]|uniref:hypothetical protein n=1 Tax=Methyloversatilis sp. TaxID=2569862 RepID=UPI003D29429F
MKTTLPLLILSASLFGGCSTITSSEMQTVTLSARTQGGDAVDQTKCTLKNDKGSWTATAPGNVMIRRSAEDLNVECKKDGMSDGFLRAISRSAGSMWGNIIFGGGIGAIIDHNKGTGYDYPNDLRVLMGESVTIDRRDEKNSTKQDVAGATAASSPAAY